MGIKAPAADLLCIQNKQNSNYPIPKNKKSAVPTINKNNQRIKEKKLNQCLKTKLSSSNELSSPATAPKILVRSHS